MVGDVAVDSCDARVLKGTRRVGITARALYRSVPTMHRARVVAWDVAGEEASQSGAYWMC
jgi:hypothetical protein